VGRNVVKIWIDVLIIIDIAEILLKLALNTNQSLIPFQRLQLLFDNSELYLDCPFVIAPFGLTTCMVQTC